VRVSLLTLVVAAHGFALSAALRMRVSPEIVPPSVLQVSWIAGEPSGPPGPPTASGEPAAAPEPPAPEPPAPEPEPEPEPPAPEPEPEPIPEPLVVAEAPPEPEAPVAPPPPPPPEKPRPEKRPKPPRPPPPKPVETPPAPAAAPSSGVLSGASPGSPAATSAPVASAGAGRNGAGGPKSEYVEPSYRAAYLSNPPPDYPRVSRRMGEEGKVALRVHITVDGHADEVVLYQGSGFERLDRAAMEAVRRWRFVPARRGRDNVPGWVLVPIQFSLES
jgi:protein TonB